MKNLRLLITGVVAAVLVTGCGVTENGFSSASMQKRKYTKGFYFSKNHRFTKGKSAHANETTLHSNETSSTDYEALVLDKKEPMLGESQVKVQTQNKQQVELRSTDIQAPKSGKADVLVSETKSEKETKQIVKSNHSDKVVTKHESNSNKSMADDLLILCIILCFFIPPLAVGIWTNIDWTKVLISLLLTLLFFLPGLIYSLLVVLDKI